MPTVTPVGSLSLSLKYLRDMIAASSNFQTRTGAANQTAALEFIHYGRFDSEVTDETVTVRHLDEQDFERISNSGFSFSTSLVATFYFPIPLAYQGDEVFDDAYLDFCNSYGQILDDVSDLPQTSGNLNIQNIGSVAIGQLDPKENNGAEIFVGEALVQTR